VSAYIQGVDIEPSWTAIPHVPVLRNQVSFTEHVTNFGRLELGEEVNAGRGGRIIYNVVDFDKRTSSGYPFARTVFRSNHTCAFVP
jgi:hypothetical protein